MSSTDSITSKKRTREDLEGNAEEDDGRDEDDSGLGARNGDAFDDDRAAASGSGGDGAAGASKRQKTEHDEDFYDDYDDDFDRDDRRRRPSSSASADQQQHMQPQQQQQQQQPSSQGSSYGQGAYQPHQQSQSGREASRVLFLRNLPPYCSEREISDVTAPFGSEKIVLLNVNKQAFVQFETPEKARQFIEIHNKQVQVRDRTVYLEYSDKKELSAPRAGSGASGGSGGGGGIPESSSLNNVILVTVTEVRYPISTDVLFKVFSKVGTVQKVVIFTTNPPDTIRALVQFSSLDMAKRAKEELDGQNIYSGCCLLRIVYSKAKELSVTLNNDKTRDFTNPHLPTGPAPGDAPGGLGAAAGMYGAAAGYGGLAALGYPAAAALYGIQPDAMTAAYGAYLAGVGTGGGRHGAAGGMPHAPMQMGRPSGPSCVIFVSGLPANFKFDDLFTVLGVYGDVKYIKILPNMQDKALVEFTSPQGAENALEFLKRGCPMHDSTIHVSPSKHANLTVPQTPDENFFKSYANAPAHRYRNIAKSTKALSNLCEPSEFLHISNIEPELSDERLREEFQKYGNVEDLKPLMVSGGNKKMYILKMDSVASAARILIELHDRFVEGSKVKVTFSSHGTRRRQ